MEIKFTKTHEWVSVEENKAKIGITDQAQSELGDIVYIELPDVNEIIKKGNVFGVIESVKTASDIYAPCSGKVLRRNDDLIDNPQLINKDAMGGGWFIEIELLDKNELNDLLSQEEYKKTN